MSSFTYSRRRFLQGLGGSAAALALNGCSDLPLGSCRVNTMPRRYAEPLSQEVENAPNVIFIFTDDQGWGDAASFGHPYLKTPNIDKLTKEGTWFQQFYVNSAVCSPSRAAVMTGRYPTKANVHWHFSKSGDNNAHCMPDALEPSIPTLADIFQSAGYKTGQFGKWHLSSENPDAASPLEYGFDEERTIISNKVGWDVKEVGLFWAKSTDLFVTETIRFISDTVTASEKTGKRTPFFANMWSFVPHAPYQLRPTDKEVYADLQVNPDDFPERMATYMRNAPNLQSQMQTYCAAVTGLDKAIGKLIDYLDAANLSNDTLIVFSSDNGPEDYAVRAARKGSMGYAGQHRGRKRSLYEGGIRTPLVARWPGVVKAGEINKSTTITAIDFVPTLSKLAGIELPSEMSLDGEDMSDVILGAERQRNRSIFWEHRFPTYGAEIDRSPPLLLRSGDWKYMTSPNGSRKELYNLRDDVEERRNLYGEERVIARRLERELLDWYKTI